jgi:hypothetical protein
MTTTIYEEWGYELADILIDECDFTLEDLETDFEHLWNFHEGFSMSFPMSCGYSQSEAVYAFIERVEERLATCGCGQKPMLDHRLCADCRTIEECPSRTVIRNTVISNPDRLVRWLTAPVGTIGEERGGQ